MATGAPLFCLLSRLKYLAWQKKRILINGHAGRQGPSKVLVGGRRISQVLCVYVSFWATCVTISIFLNELRKVHSSSSSSSSLLGTPEESGIVPVSLPRTGYCRSIQRRTSSLFSSVVQFDVCVRFFFSLLHPRLH